MGSLNYGYLMDNYPISHNNINKSNCEKWHDDNINYELCKINVKSNKNKSIIINGNLSSSLKSISKISQCYVKYWGISINNDLNNNFAFPNENIGNDNNTNYGKVNINNGKFTIRAIQPNGYYKNNTYISPSLNFQIFDNNNSSITKVYTVYFNDNNIIKEEFGINSSNSPQFFINNNKGPKNQEDILKMLAK